jgi:hypothetical protein
MGIVSRIAALRSGVSAPPVMSVSIIEGQTALTRMLSGASSRAAAFV